MTRIDELIRRLPATDERLSEALISEYYNFIYHFGCSILGDPGEADDAAQETFIHALRGIGNYQPGSNLKAWLARIAVNVCRSRLRRRKSQQMLQNVLKLRWLNQPASYSGPEEAVVLSEFHHDLRRAVERLREKHRLPVLLRYVHGLTIAEIADALQIPEGTVYSRLHYAHRELRGCLSSSAPARSLSEEVDR